MRDDWVDGNRFREGRRNQEHLGIPCILIQTIRRSSGVAGYGKEIELIDDDFDLSGDRLRYEGTQYIGKRVSGGHLSTRAGD